MAACTLECGLGVVALALALAFLGLCAALVMAMFALCRIARERRFQLILQRPDRAIVQKVSADGPVVQSDTTAPPEVTRSTQASPGGFGDGQFEEPDFIDRAEA